MLKIVALTAVGLGAVSGIWPHVWTAESRGPETPTLRADPTLPTPARLDATGVWDRLPLGYEVNRGQTDGRVDFLARCRGYTAFVTSSEVALDLAVPSMHAPSTAPAAVDKPDLGEKQRSVLWLEFVGARTVQPVATGALPGRSAHLSCPRRSRAAAAPHRRAAYRW